MNNIIWAPSALRDLEQIQNFIESESDLIKVLAVLDQRRSLIDALLGRLIP